jgi:predicted DNA-binding ribbon-helix-helix protein
MRESGFWSALKEIAAHDEISVSLLVTRIDTDGEHANLSSAVRLFVLAYYMTLAKQKTAK